MRKLKTRIAIFIFCGLLSNTGSLQAQDDPTSEPPSGEATSEEKESKRFDFQSRPAKLSLMIGLANSYDQDGNKVGGTAYGFTIAKHIFQGGGYLSLTMGGSHAYRYVTDSVDTTVSAMTADIGLGATIRPRTSGLFGGLSVGVFGGVGTRNNGEAILPMRFGISSQLNINAANFNVWWKDEKGRHEKALVGAYIRFSFSAFSFDLRQDLKLAMNEAIEFGIKWTILEPDRAVAAPTYYLNN